MNTNTTKSFFIGYWSSPKYFDSIKDVLKRDFQCKVPLSEHTQQWKKRITEDSNVTVSLHIRRGDYLESAINRKIYKIMSIPYYQECINRLKNEYPNISMYIFSNDMAWAKENLDFDGVQVFFVEGNDEDHGYEDMILMWECTHHVIANSTFSWWGAYLSRQNGKVYAPTEWFNIKGDHYDIKDLYPSDWIKIDVC